MGSSRSRLSSCSHAIMTIGCIRLQVIDNFTLTPDSSPAKLLDDMAAKLSIKKIKATLIKPSATSLQAFERVCPSCDIFENTNRNNKSDYERSKAYRRRRTHILNSSQSSGLPHPRRRYPSSPQTICISDTQTTTHHIKRHLHDCRHTRQRRRVVGLRKHW